MLSLKNKIVFITGASSGIGRACAQQFAAQGAKLILTARRIERINQLAKELKQAHDTESLCLSLDVQDKHLVNKTLQELPQAWQSIDILLNNAGLALDTYKIQEGDIEHWDTMINTNVAGLLYVTRAILPGMLQRQQGHIINIGSVAGRGCYIGGNVYSATKYAVKAISESLLLDLLGTGIRTTEIAPGAVETEFSEVRWNDKARAKQFYTDFTPLEAEDIADAVLYCATRPLHVDVAEMVIYPTHQASCNHIHRQPQSAKQKS